MTAIRAFRSLLFAPGASPRKIDKALSSEADGVIVDLEDSVALAEKASARAAVAAALARPLPKPTFVRVNPVSTAAFSDDLKALTQTSPYGIMIPKVESAADLRTVDEALVAFGDADTGSHCVVEVLPILETARGLAAAVEIAKASRRVRRLTFGAIDLALDMSVSIDEPQGVVDHARFLVALTSRAEGLEQPFDTAFADFRDLARLKAEALRARAFGFFGKGCIHPDQVAVVNAVFTPTETEIAQARRVVEAFDEAERNGLAAIQVDGRMIDYPVASRARRMLAQARPSDE